jgi:predicted MFS family arabinose efflux permease
VLLLAIPEVGMAIGHNSIRPFLSLFFEERHGLAPGVIGSIMFGLALAGGIGALVIPSLSHRIGNIAAIRILRVSAAALIFLCFSGVPIAAVVGILLIHYTINDGTEATFITEAMERLPDDRRSIFSGLYAMLWSAASFTAGAVSGAIQDRPGWGFGVAFCLGSCGYLFSVLWVSVVFPRLRRPVELTLHERTLPEAA